MWCPQGSILGPLRCIIYVNDIYVSENCSTILFADNTIIFFTGPNPTTMNDAICCKHFIFYSCFSADKLSPNVSKTN